jgi:hypothetical protein
MCLQRGENCQQKELPSQPEVESSLTLVGPLLNCIELTIHHYRFENCHFDITNSFQGQFMVQQGLSSTPKTSLLEPAHVSSIELIKFNFIML